MFSLKFVAKNVFRSQKVLLFLNRRQFFYQTLPRFIEKHGTEFASQSTKYDHDINIRRRRLLLSSRKRGRVETELFLGGYAAQNIWKMNEKELDEFEKILKEQDYDLFNWFTDLKPAPPELQKLEMFQKIKQYIEDKKNKHYSKEDTFNTDYEATQYHP